VVLSEKFAPPDDAHNAALLAKYPGYLVQEDGKARPRSERITLLQADIRQVAPSADMPRFDFVFTSSVYEHLDDVDGITCSLAALTQPDGLHVHYVDLRDHFFKYPFEMLTFSEKAWRGWLNPTSNHNRFRLRDYRRVFEEYFEEVAIDVLERNEAAFERVQQRVRPEFRTGSLQDDSVTLILLSASRPKPVKK
jgi:SAM-dependent methyltransferase